MSLLLPGTQMTVFILNDKSWALKEKLELQRMFICYHELHGISTLKGFSGKIGGILTNVGFDIAVSSLGLFT